MFEPTGEDTLLYKGGAEQWKKEYVAYIQAKAGELTTENVQDWIDPVYHNGTYLAISSVTVASAVVPAE